MKHKIGCKTVMTSVAAISAVGATSAEAQSEWTGLYGGLSFSSLSGDLVDGVDTYFDATSELDNKPQLGAFIGFNAEVGGLIAGAEIAHTGGSFPVNGNTDYEASSLTDVKLKLGKAFGNNLFYGIAGMSRMDTAYNGCDDCMADGSGMAFGIGVEHKFSERFSVGLEYLNRKMDTQYSSSSNISSVALRGVIHF